MTTAEPKRFDVAEIPPATLQEKILGLVAQTDPADQMACVVMLVATADLRPREVLALTWEDIDLRSGKSKSGKKLSGTTVNCTHKAVSVMFTHAVKEGVVAYNPCKDVDTPKTDTEERKPLSGDKVHELVGKLDPTQPMEIAIILCVTLGLRRGEVCALRWSDLNDNGTISVRRAMGYAEGGFYEKDPKTFTSARTIPLTRYTFMMLSAIKEDAYRLLTRLGVPQADPYILGTQELDSRPYNPTLLGKDFTAFCKMNNFHCTFHDLRHTFATFMIGSGVDVRTVASYLGHSSVSMTLDVYADVDPEAKFSAVGKIEEAFDNDSNEALSLLAQHRGFDPTGEYDTDEIPGAHPEAVRNRKGFKAGMGNFTLSAQSIPFTEEELEDMLATIRAAKQKKPFSA